MVPKSVPPEVAQRIARSAVDCRTLSVLARTTRTLQTAAEKRLYETLEFFHGPHAHKVCKVLAVCPRVAAYVRTFLLAVVTHRTRDRDHSREEQAACVIQRSYWDTVRAALANLQALNYFHLADPTYSNAWVLHPTNNWALRPLEVRLFVPWDAHIAAFLEVQDRLESLCIAEVAENEPLAPISESALPSLTQFEGPLMLVDQLMHCPITHLKVPVDTEDAVSLLPLVLPELRRFRKLRSLCVTSIPPEMSLSSVAAIATACPLLKYLSNIPLPSEHKARLVCLQHLARLHELTFLEVDISHWIPLPTGPLQRIFAVELRMCLPRLSIVFFWNRHERWVWEWNPDDVEPVHSQQIVGGRDTGEAGGAGGAVDDEGAADFVGLEGWKYSVSQPHWVTHSTTWRSN